MSIKSIVKGAMLWSLLDDVFRCFVCQWIMTPLSIVRAGFFVCLRVWAKKNAYSINFFIDFLFLIYYIGGVRMVK